MNPMIVSLRALEQTLPALFPLIEQELRRRGRKPGPGGYPFSPLTWATLVKGAAQSSSARTGYPRRTDENRKFLHKVLSIAPAALAWNHSRQIYRVDPTTLGHLFETESSGDIPLNVLNALPHPCFYLEAPSDLPTPDGNTCKVDGLLVYRRTFPGEKGEDVSLTILPISSSGEGLEGLFTGHFYLSLTGAEAEKYYRESGTSAKSLIEFSVQHSHEAQHQGAILRPETMNWLLQQINVLLYLTSDRPDIIEGQKDQPGIPKAEPTPKGKTSYWDVGFREGSAFRTKMQEIETYHGSFASETVSETPNRKPHWRRAHWHRFWTGSRAEPENRILLPKWVAAVPVLGTVQEMKEQPVVRRSVRP